MELNIKATIKGKDIRSSDMEDFMIHSGYYNLKEMEQGAGWPTTVTVASGQFCNTYTVTHDLGYKPLFDFYFEDDDGYIIHIPGKSPMVSSAIPSRAVLNWQTNDYIRIILGRNDTQYTSNTTYNVHHHIFVDPQ